MQDKVLTKAKYIVNMLRDVSQEKDLWWATPLVNFNKPSVVILEWWHFNKKATLHINEESTEYIVCGEGKDGIYKVQCGRVKSDKELRNIWVWLTIIDFAKELEDKSYSVSEEDAALWREVIFTEMQPGFPAF